MGLTLKLQEVTGQHIDAEPASRSKIQSLEGQNHSSASGSPVAERKCRFKRSDRNARTSANATSPESGPELDPASPGADSSASRTH
jgi:hypothetical protein